jgi:hypothetical protein
MGKIGNAEGVQAVGFVRAAMSLVQDAGFRCLFANRHAQRGLRIKQSESRAPLMLCRVYYARRRKFRPLCKLRRASSSSIWNDGQARCWMSYKLTKLLRDSGGGLRARGRNAKPRV